MDSDSMVQSGGYEGDLVASGQDVLMILFA